LIGANDFSQFLRGNLRDGLFRSKEMTNEPEAQPTWRHSPILGMVRDRWQRRRSAIHAEDSVGSNILRRRLKRQSARIRNSVPGLDEALRGYETQVDALVHLARSSGLRPIFVTQPTLWNKNLGQHARS